ncbi:hypothetical protein DM860_012721 [Cuscuta australis]|uniref:RING-type E3 ubiquitin transferase n=1 Tax=Cuscuta australis TaxID=267555 RepID=A0A328DEA0_9ASTE|nr:hypothetical protein DM860_012721 [Cuscuta australis]
MDDSCAVCAENLEWVAYGPCGHKDVCSTCVARLRFICDDRRCCICKTENSLVFVTKALGDYTRNIIDFSSFPHDPKEGRMGSYWYHEDTQSFFDDSDHYKMIRAMCRLSCSVCDNIEQASDGPRRRGKFRNIEQLKGHLFHQHRLLMCSLCLEGRKIFICEQKLYNRAQLNQHVNTGDSEVDGTESERGGFTGHPMCEFCRTPFYGDNELYLHMSTEHYTCHLCQRQHPGQYEYYKNYDDLEIHFRGNHFLCEDESCLVKKFVVFLSEAELKRHNALEHGGRMSRSKRNAALQIPTSFRYRRSNEQDGHRGRGRMFRRDASETELSMAIEASLETANSEGRSQDASSSSRRTVISDHAEETDFDPLISQFELIATSGPELSSRYRKAVSQQSSNTLEESSFPPLPIAPSTQQPIQAESSQKNTMAARLRRQSNKTENILGLGSASSRPSHAAPTGRQSNKTASVPGSASHTAPSAINMHHAWPVVRSVSESSASCSGQSKPADGNGSSMISHQHARPAVSSSFGSTSTSVRHIPSFPSQTRSAVVNESTSAGSSSSSRNWASTTRIPHTTSAPNLVESQSFDSSNFPPVSSQTLKLPASSQPTTTGIGDIHTANKSLVERIRSSLSFDEDKYAAFKDISGEYRRRLINAETYLANVDQFGLLHLVYELARLCPDIQKQNELIDTYNANFRHSGSGQSDSETKDSSVSKKGKGKSIDAGDNNNTPKIKLADSIMHTVKNLQSSYRPSEDSVEVLLKDDYRASSKGKSKATSFEKELMPHSEALKLKDQSSLLGGGGSDHTLGDGHSKNKQKKKTSKFLRARLGDEFVESHSNLKNSISDRDLYVKQMPSGEESKSPEGLPVRGVWRNGGGQKLLASSTSRGTKK